MPFAIYSKQQPTQAKLVSSTARHRKARPRGSLGCPSLIVSDSWIRELTRNFRLSARAADLLACPPHLLHKNCLSCSYHTSPALQPLGEDVRHFIRCPKGLRLRKALFYLTAGAGRRDELAYILERCNIHVIAERPRGHIGKCRASCSKKARSSSNNQTSPSPTLMAQDRLLIL